MMDQLDLATELCRGALFTAMQIALPVLVVGLVIGLLVSIFQAVTQIQEQTLSIIPKLLAMAATLFFFMPWILNVVTDYTRSVLTTMMNVVLGS